VPVSLFVTGFVGFDGELDVFEPDPDSDVGEFVDEFPELVEARRETGGPGN
jgi:hypothetical protein